MTGLAKEFFTFRDASVSVSSVKKKGQLARFGIRPHGSCADTSAVFTRETTQTSRSAIASESHAPCP